MYFHIERKLLFFLVSLIDGAKGMVRWRVILGIYQRWHEGVSKIEEIRKNADFENVSHKCHEGVGK